MLATPNIASAEGLRIVGKSTDFISNDGRFSLPPQYSGKVVVLTIWASWCPLCQLEMPEILKLQRKYQGRGLEVIAVSLDRDTTKKTAEEQIKAYLDKIRGHDLNLIIDSRGDFLRAFRMKGMPTTYIYDRKGWQVDSILGEFKGTSEENIKRFDGLLRD